MQDGELACEGDLVPAGGYAGPFCAVGGRSASAATEGVLRLELTDGRIPGALCARPVLYFRSECNATSTHLASFGNH